MTMCIYIWTYMCAGAQQHASSLHLIPSSLACPRAKCSNFDALSEWIVYTGIHKQWAYLNLSVTLWMPLSDDTPNFWNSLKPTYWNTASLDFCPRKIPWQSETNHLTKHSRLKLAATSWILLISSCGTHVRSMWSRWCKRNYLSPSLSLYNLYK